MYEIVVREKPKKTIYIRKAPDRSFEAGSIYRKLNMLQFAEIGRQARGKKYEDVIKDFVTKMKPVGRTVKVREVIITDRDLLRMRLHMLRKGITKLKLPKNIKLKIITRPEREEIVKRIVEKVLV